jgi:LPXTG-site transpeptidase (sortase) family protein
MVFPMYDNPAPRSRSLVAAVLFLCGLALLGRASWSVFGSNVATGRTQAALTAELSEQDPALVFSDQSLKSIATQPSDSLAGVQRAPVTPDVSEPSDVSLAAVVSSGLNAPEPVPTASGALGRLTAPSIGLDVVFVSGVSRKELKKGPGWMPDTALPGTAGNTVLSGHRTTYGAPFRHLDDLTAGDRVTLELDGVQHVYEVRDSFVVAPGDTWVAAPTTGVRLTLTTCHPEGSDRQRLVVQAELVDGPAQGAAEPADTWQRSQS